ncbi:GNAT family N-acetyltransferase [Streptomyces griseorubens]|uniref:GNAT family N-acetyltransferase n=1 Tax=Streptomyces griseorubens TaxID=66897 RepID=UPI003F252666
MSDDGTTRIRVAVEEDASVVARIHMASRSATMPYLPPQKRDHEQVSRWVQDVVLRRCRTWVAVRRAEIVGYAALDGDMLDHLYLRPDVRRQGIGTLLLDEVRSAQPGRTGPARLPAEHRCPRVLRTSRFHRPGHQRREPEHGEPAGHDPSLDAEQRTVTALRG